LTRVIKKQFGKKMKSVLIVLVFLFTCTIMAQEQTLLSGQITHGGYGGPEVKFTQINNTFGVLVGGKGGWIVNHTFSIGGGGYGLVNRFPVRIDNEDYYLNFGYGGVILEYIMDWDQLLHYTFSALIGGGGVGYRDRTDHERTHSSGNRSFFVVEPGANAEVNITSFFRLNLGVSYRLLSGVSLERYNEQNLSGLSANLTFKFGKF
jgi:hypothetical protein